MTTRWANQRAIYSVYMVTLVMGCAAAPEDAADDPASLQEIVGAVSLSPTRAVHERRSEWRKSMSKTDLPKDGCFVVTHPSTTWQEVPCASPSKGHITPLSPKRGGSGLLSVGNGTDFSAQTTNKISWAEGSFPIVTGVTSVSSGGVNGSYGLQLNSNVFSGPDLCAGATVPGCQGWQQFGYQPGVIFIEYWIFNYGDSCPPGWQEAGNESCVKDSQHLAVPAEPITNLANMTLIGRAGTSDSIFMSNGNDTLFGLSQASQLQLNRGWTTAEFNVFGANNLQQAVFNSGSTIVVQTLTNTSPITTTAPACISAGTTGETNNLTLTPNSCCPVSGSHPGIQFTESFPAGAPAQTCPLTMSQIQLPVAFQASTHYLWLDQNGSAFNPGLLMKAGSVPSLVTLPSGGLGLAFQINNGDLWFDLNGSADSTFLGVLLNTSPSMTVLQNGQTEIAFQGSNGHLWFYQNGTSTDTGGLMKSQTSPSIAVLPNGQVAFAFQGVGGHLWMGWTGPKSGQDSGGAMKAGTSPSVAALPNGQVAFAFQGSNGHLWIGQNGLHSGQDKGYAMMTGTSPSIAVLVDGTVAAAFESNSGNLWLYRNGAATDTGFGMAIGTSPSILPMPGAGYQIAFAGSNGNLWIDLNGVAVDQGFAMSL